jgi:acetyl/propionyl-CoA carboxylase alpha subunit
VRNDAGVYRGYTIPIHYDSLLAKLIVWGADREQARRRLLRALDEYVLEGVHHNLAFHRWLAAHPEFAAGRFSTRFLEDHFKPAALTPGPDVEEVALIAAALHARLERQAIALPADGAQPASAWRWLDARRRGARGGR